MITSTLWIQFVYKGCIALGSFALLIVLVLVRSKKLKAMGIQAMRSGETDKSDFLLPPFVLLFFYLIAAHTFGWPRLGVLWFRSEVVGWIGVLLFALFAWGMISFGNSFRVGIDTSHSGSLVTTGAFAVSRNPL